MCDLLTVLSQLCYHSGVSWWHQEPRSWMPSCNLRRSQRDHCYGAQHWLDGERCHPRCEDSEAEEWGGSWKISDGSLMRERYKGCWVWESLKRSQWWHSIRIVTDPIKFSIQVALRPVSKLDLHGSGIWNAMFLGGARAFTYNWLVQPHKLILVWPIVAQRVWETAVSHLRDNLSFWRIWGVADSSPAHSKRL